MPTSREWLDHATGDLEASRRQIADGTQARITCFHAQQAIEKLIKAVLTQQGTPFPWKHDLTALEALLTPQLQVKTSVLDLGFLNDFAVGARYPGFTVVSPADAAIALEVAEAAFALLSGEVP